MEVLPDTRCSLLARFWKQPVLRFARHNLSGQGHWIPAVFFRGHGLVVVFVVGRRHRVHQCWSAEALEQKTLKKYMATGTKPNKAFSCDAPYNRGTYRVSYRGGGLS